MLQNTTSTTYHILAGIFDLVLVFILRQKCLIVLHFSHLSLS